MEPRVESFSATFALLSLSLSLSLSPNVFCFLLCIYLCSEQLDQEKTLRQTEGKRVGERENHYKRTCLLFHEDKGICRRLSIPLERHVQELKAGNSRNIESEREYNERVRQAAIQRSGRGLRTKWLRDGKEQKQTEKHTQTNPVAGKGGDQIERTKETILSGKTTESRRGKR